MNGMIADQRGHATRLRPPRDRRLAVAFPSAIDAPIRTLSLRPSSHSDSVLAVPAVLALRAVRAASGLLFRLGRHLPVSVREGDRADRRCRNKLPAAIAVGMFREMGPVPSPGQ